MTSRDTSLATALAILGGGLDDPTIDIGRGLAQLTAAVGAVVPSYCGLSITLVIDGIPVTITAREHDYTPDDQALDNHALDRSTPDVAASLLVPLSAITVTTHGELVLFATVAGAFVDLAADLAYETATELATYALDTRLGPAADTSVGVGAFSVINQAMGMLIDAGHTPEQARARIADVAAHDGHDLVEAAARILRGDER